MAISEISASERLAGGLVGLLVGDALGVPYEFHSRAAIPPPAEIEFDPPLGFVRAHAGVRPGTWSDDGAQALILLDSLLDCGRFDPARFAQGLMGWNQSGFMAVDGEVFDVGIQTAAAIRRLQAGVAPLEAGATDERSNGNGSLMRVLPLALWHRGSDSALIADAFDQSAVTHGHVRSKLCCSLYCLWARNIIIERDDAWQAAVESLCAAFARGSLEREELERRIVPSDDDAEISGSGYVVHSLHAASWANSHDSYEAVVKAAISLGDDTDTTACIAGGIAGLRFGVDAIPKRWRDRLRGGSLYQPLLAKLLSAVT